MNESAGTARRLAKDGYGVYGIDYEGHGKSDGLPALVTDFNLLVDDCSQYFTSISGILSLHTHMYMHACISFFSFWNSHITELGKGR